MSLKSISKKRVAFSATIVYYQNIANERYTKMETTESVIKRLKEIGFSLSKIARRLTVSKSTVYRWSVGEMTPRVTYFAKLLELFDTKPKEVETNVPDV